MTAQPPPRGLTLLELLLVLAAIAILAVVTLPSVSGIQRGSRLSQAGRLLADQLALARQTAQSRNVPVRVYFLQTDGRWNGVQVAAQRVLNAYETTIESNARRFDPVRRRMAFPDGVVLSRNAGRSNVLALGGNLTWTDAGRTWDAARAVEFHPEAGASLVGAATAPSPLTVTLCMAEEAESADPSNYVLVVIDTETGKTRTVRP